MGVGGAGHPCRTPWPTVTATPSQTHAPPPPTARRVQTDPQHGRHECAHAGGHRLSSRWLRRAVGSAVCLAQADGQFPHQDLQGVAGGGRLGIEACGRGGRRRGGGHWGRSARVARPGRGMGTGAGRPMRVGTGSCHPTSPDPGAPRAAGWGRRWQQRCFWARPNACHSAARQLPPSIVTLLPTPHSLAPAAGRNGGRSRRRRAPGGRASCRAARRRRCAGGQPAGRRDPEAAGDAGIRPRVSGVGWRGGGGGWVTGGGGSGRGGGGGDCDHLAARVPPPVRRHVAGPSLAPPPRDSAISGSTAPWRRPHSQAVLGGARRTYPSTPPKTPFQAEPGRTLRPVPICWRRVHPRR